MESDELDPATLVLLLAGHLRERIISHPFSTLGGAAAVGYVLGFGLPGALLRTAGALALRAASMQLLDEVLGPGSERRASEGGVAGGRHEAASVHEDVDPFVA